MKKQDCKTMKKGLLIFTLLLAQWCAATAQELLPYPIDTIQGQAVYRYEVEKSIGLYRISVNFSVSQEDIIRWNPELKDRGLHYGETLYIPVAGKTVPVAKHSVAPAVPAEAQPVSEPVTLPEKEDKPALILEEVHKDTLPADTLALSAQSDSSALHIALMLPFQARNTKRDRNMDRFVDFYEGVLLAIRELQADTTRFILDVYDTEKSDLRVRQLIDSGRLEGVDAVLGLAYPMQLMQVGEWAKEKQVPVLAPFIDHIEGIETNPYILQFNPSSQQEAQAMAEWLSEHREKVNCVLIDAKEADIPQSISLLRREIIVRDIPTTTTSIRNILNDSLGTALRNDVENILIFNTEKYSNIQVLIPRVQKAAGERSITLYSKYSWSKENIPLPQIFTSVFKQQIIDDAVYEEDFQRYFGHEHTTDTPRFDLLGYDLMKELVAYLQGTEYHGLQSDIRFEHISAEGGLVNTNIEIQRINP